MNYLSYIKTNVLNFALAFGLAACQSGDGRYIRLSGYLHDVHAYELPEQISAVAVITDRGNCMNCNNSFSKFIASEMDNERLLFLICSSGFMIDISPFLVKNERILMDQHDKFKETELTKKSGVIFLDQEKIDTIIEISTETAEMDFELILKKLHP